MTISNSTLILILFVLFVLHTCDPAHGHGTHLTDNGQPTVTIKKGTFTGMTFETTTGKCYVITKEGHEVLTYPTTLHIREVTCK